MKISQTEILFDKGTAEFFKANENLYFEAALYNRENDNITHGTSEHDTVINRMLSEYKHFEDVKNLFTSLVLCAIAHMGACDLVAVRKYIKLVYEYSDLDSRLVRLIENTDNARNAAKKLLSAGLIIKHNFKILDTEDQKRATTIYVPTATGVDIVRSIYQKKVTKERNIALLSPKRLAGKACTNLIALETALNIDTNKVSYSEGRFTTPLSGELYTDCRIKASDENGNLDNIGFISLYMDFIEGFHTEGNILSYYSKLIEICKQYKHRFGNNGNIARLVFVFPDKDALIEFAKYLVTKAEELLSIIYFTNELAYRENFIEPFLQLVQNDNGSYEFTKCKVV